MPQPPKTPGTVSPQPGGFGGVPTGDTSGKEPQAQPEDAFVVASVTISPVATADVLINREV